MDIAILRFFESIRCPALTVFFSFFTLFGESTVIAAIVILVYWLAPKRTGEQIAVAFLTSLPLNVMIKCTAARPRPYAAGVVSRVEIDTPVLSTMDLGDNMSFPSGHTQFTSLFSVSAAIRVKKVLVWVLTPLFVLLVMCSRLYLGVHYPTDLLAGLAFGVFAAVVWELVYTYAYGARRPILLALALVALVGVLFCTEKDYLQAAGLISGAAVFLCAADFLPAREPSSFPRRLLRIPAGAVVAGAVFALTLLFPADPGLSLLKWFLIAGAATFGAQGVFTLFKL